METTEQKIEKLEKAIASPATPEAQKEVMKVALEKLKEQKRKDFAAKMIAESESFSNDDLDEETKKAFLNLKKIFIENDLNLNDDTQRMQALRIMSTNPLYENDIKLIDLRKGKVGQSKMFQEFKQVFNELENNELKKGIEVEQEHKETLDKVAAGEITVPEAIKETAESHIAENPNYYEELEEIESKQPVSNEQMKSLFSELKVKAKAGVKPSLVGSLINSIDDELASKPSLYKFYVEEYMAIPKKYRPSTFNVFDVDFGSTSPYKEVAEWLKSMGKTMFDVLGVEDFKLPKEVEIKTTTQDENFMKLHSAIVGSDDLRPIMTGTHFESDVAVSTDAHKMLITPYRGEVNNEEGTYCYTKKCFENEKDVKEGKYPNWKAVIPMRNKAYQFNTDNLYQYLKNSFAKSIIQETTKSIELRYDEKRIGFNGEFLIDCLDVMLKLGHKNLEIAIGEPNKAAIICPVGAYQNIYNTKLNGSDYVLLMPVMLDSDRKPAPSVNGSFDIETSTYLDINGNKYIFDASKRKTIELEKRVNKLEKKNKAIKEDVSSKDNSLVVELQGKIKALQEENDFLKEKATETVSDDFDVDIDNLTEEQIQEFKDLKEFCEMILEGGEK